MRVMTLELQSQTRRLGVAGYVFTVWGRAATVRTGAGYDHGRLDPDGAHGLGESRRT